MRWPAQMAGLAMVAVSMTVIDLLWLGIFARDFYAEALGPLLAKETNWPAALAFYLFYVLSIWLYAVRPSETTGRAAKTGALLGCFAYGVYELTNTAVVEGWPAILIPVDWAWGIFLTASVAAAGHWTQEKLR